MKTSMSWKSGMKFQVETDGHTIDIDAKSPIGKGEAMTPKELVLVGLGGCTAMDVVAWLRKHKQTFASIKTDVETNLTKGYPSVFETTTISFWVTGQVDPQILLEAVKLSQTKYCGVSAMLSKAFDILYEVYLNNEKIGSGKAEF